MQRILFFLLILITFFGCKPKNPNGYYVDGNISIDSLEGKWVYLVPSFKEMDVVLDSCQIQKGRFKMEGDVGFNSYLALMIITDSNRTPINPLVGANVVIEPGNIKVTFNEKREPSIGGTPQNNLIQRCDDAINNFNKRCEELANSSYSTEMKYQEWIKARNERNSILLDEMENNINSEKVQALFLEYYPYFTKSELEQIERRMDENTRSNSRIQTALKSKNVAIGERYIDFILLGRNCDTVSLASLIVKTYYCLDNFWASWCGQCL